jgi:hypothetical protein
MGGGYLYTRADSFYCFIAGRLIQAANSKCQKNIFLNNGRTRFLIVIDYRGHHRNGISINTITIYNKNFCIKEQKCIFEFYGKAEPINAL